jgi:hypothetical protein
LSTPSDNSRFSNVSWAGSTGAGHGERYRCRGGYGHEVQSVLQPQEGRLCAISERDPLAFKQGVDLAWLFGDVEGNLPLSEMSPRRSTNSGDKLGVAEGKKPATQMRRRSTQSSRRRSASRISSWWSARGYLVRRALAQKTFSWSPRGRSRSGGTGCRAKGVRASQLIVADIVGDSMEPTLFHGDTVVFNAAHKRVRRRHLPLQSRGAAIREAVAHKPGHSSR